MLRRSINGFLTRYVNLRVTHAPGMPGTFSPPPQASDPNMHHGTCVTHVPWCSPGSITSGILRNRCRGKRSRHSRHMRSTQFCVRGPWNHVSISNTQLISVSRMGIRDMARFDYKIRFEMICRRSMAPVIGSQLMKWGNKYRIGKL